MRIETIAVHSFARFVHAFELPLSRQGLVLVEGVNLDSGDAFNSNGAGKSMLFEPIPWVFYDKMARYGDERLGADEVCYAGNDADVEARFETSRGRFLARRRRRQRGSSQLAVHAWQETDWVPLQGVAPDVVLATHDLTTLLGFDYRTLRSAIFLQGTALTVAASTYAEQMRTLESVLRFDEFTRGAERARERYRALDDDVRGQINELARLSQIVETAQSTIHELETLDETEREHELMAGIRNLRQAESVADANVYYIVSADALERAFIEQSAADAAHTDARERAERLYTLSGQTCPTCGGKLDEERLREERIRADETCRAAESAANAGRAKVSERRRPVEDARRAVDLARQVERDLRNADRELLDLRERKAKRLQMIQTQQERRDTASGRLIELTSTIANARRQLQIAENWARRDFEALKAETLGASAPILNDASARYSNILTDGALRVEFNTLRESRSDKLLRLTRADGSEADYKSLSNGERRRVDLIVALSLRVLARWRLRGEPINITVWDEVFDPLDDDGIARVIQVLQQDVDELESVFVITHNPTLRALFPGGRTWRVVRERGVSHVEFD